MMAIAPPVLPYIFKAIEKSDIEKLSFCSESEIRPLLPCLVRMSLIAPLDHSQECILGRKVILCILSGIEAVNALVALLSIDFTALEVDVKREQSLRQKLGAVNQNESILIQGLSNGLALEFECSDPTRRLRLLLSELLMVMAQMREPRQHFYVKSSELFDNECYLEEVSDVLCIALAELPYSLHPGEVAETLLHLTNGTSIICKMVANQPDCFREVVLALVVNGEKQDEESTGSSIRIHAIRLLCQMNPSQALNVRGLCVEHCVMPALTILITLDVAKACESNRLPYSSVLREASGGNGPVCLKKGTDMGPAGIPTNVSSQDSDIVSFLIGILLSRDHQQRMWFSQYIKNALRKKSEHPNLALAVLRMELVDRLRNFLLFTTSDTLPDSQVIHATTLLRLYCALKSMAAFKLNEEKEVGPLLQLITCHPPRSAAGVRFVITGLCMVISCPSLIALTENERRTSDWIKWLVREQDYFVATNDVSTSFGTMLLLLAIHFHLQQLGAIIDLVSAALGMKVAFTSPVSTRVSNLSKIKYIFTHDVFTEQVVTAHAVKVPVTKNLNGTMHGFLPVHCIYHQLKSHMFTKHKVPIKSWIYKQICCCTTPIHNMMPQLIESYVSSVLIPPSKNVASEVFNEPFSEEEIMAVFSLPSFTEYTKDKKHKVWNSSQQMLKNSLLQQASSSVKPNIEVSSVVTSQLLLLYYLLLFEDLRLLNMHQSLMSKRCVLAYSPHLFAQLPIHYLLYSTQREQKLYAGVFSSLLKLLITHYPQLCLVEDWMYKVPSINYQMVILRPRLTLTVSSLSRAMQEAPENPGHLLVLLDGMLRLPSNRLWSLVSPFVSGIKGLLSPLIPRKILDTYRLVWLKLNSLFPRRLWVMTVEVLRRDDDNNGEVHQPNRLALSEEDIVLDPLSVLRADRSLLRCAPLLEIVVYMLQVYLLSSRTYLTQHMQNNPSSGALSPSGIEERDKLKCALILTQESAAIQVLLEAAASSSVEEVGSGFIMQEIRSIVCSFLHQAFIKDTTLAKLVHFQGYSNDLIGPVVEGVPSMHIAVGLSWIPELLQLPNLEKRLFALTLTSHLALQNAMPPTLSIARLVISTLSTLISVLSEDEKTLLIEESVYGLIRIGSSFPSLMDDLVHLLVNFGRIAAAQGSLISAPLQRSIYCYSFDGHVYDNNHDDANEKNSVKLWSVLPSVARHERIELRIKAAFRTLVAEAAAAKQLY